MAAMIRIGTRGLALGGLALAGLVSLAGCDLVKFPGFSDRPVAETREARRVPPPPPLEPVNPIQISEDFWTEEAAIEPVEPAGQAFGGPAEDGQATPCDGQAEPCEP